MTSDPNVKKLNKQIDEFEQKYDYDMTYARDVVAVDPEQYLRFYQATRLGDYRATLPLAGHWAARALGIIAGDCGPCTQLTVKLGAEAGVPEAIVGDVVSGNWDNLPDDVRLCARFSRALLERQAELPELRERLVERFGQGGAVAVAYALISSYMYPTLKYALGHGHTCSPVLIAGKRVSIAPPTTTGPTTTGPTTAGEVH